MASIRILEENLTMYLCKFMYQKVNGKLTSASEAAVSSPSSSGIGLYCFLRAHFKSNLIPSLYGRADNIISISSSLALDAMRFNPSSPLKFYFLGKHLKKYISL